MQFDVENTGQTIDTPSAILDPRFSQRGSVSAMQIEAVQLTRIKALIRETIVPVIAQGEVTAQSFTGSARDLFERLVREYWRLVGETSISSIPRLMIAEAGNFPELARFYYEEVVTRGHRLMAGVLERGIKAGEFRPVNLAVATKLAMSPLMHAVVARKAFSACMPEGFDVASYLDTHIDLYLHGIAKK